VTVLSLLKVWASAANVRGLDYLQLGMVADQLERAGMPQSADGLWCVPTAAELPAGRAAELPALLDREQYPNAAVIPDRQQPPTAPTPEAVEPRSPVAPAVPSVLVKLYAARPPRQFLKVALRCPPPDRDAGGHA